MNFRKYDGPFIVPVAVSLLFAIAVVCIVLWLLFNTVTALAADNIAPCLTKEQAKAKYPGAWLYWHGTNHCWDNQKGRSAATYASRPAVWGGRNSLKLAKPNPDANGNIIHHSGRPVITDPVPGPSIAYPTLMTGGGTSDDMLQAGSMTSWPVIMDFDVEPPQFIPWQNRIAAAF